MRIVRFFVVACLAGCSSSETPTASGADAAVIDGAQDTSPTGSDKTTGLVCATDKDCDKTSSGIAHCTNVVYAVGPLNPTAVCTQYDDTDVCTPTDSSTIHFCDSNLGLCVKRTGGKATCEPMCIMGADGSFEQKCAGANGCNIEAFGTDSSTMKVSLIGTCQAGCRADSECAMGSKCDPLQRFCSKVCTSDTDCTKGWSGAPDNWKCDTARGACTFMFPKKIGDTCSSSTDCLCFHNTGESNGVCIGLCRNGDDCGAGFVCDALLPRKDDTGADLFTMTTQPAELVGYCLKSCSADADCPANQACDLSAGQTQKTCRPKPATAADGGM